MPIPKAPRQVSPPKSTLEQRPGHVHAIGMITVEMANLEIELGDLLGALLHISPEAGRLVYLTPHSGFGRLAIVENLVKATLLERSEGRTHLEGLLSRARAIMGKRHRFIHGAWGLPTKDREGEVRWHDLPFCEDKPSRPVPVSELKNMVENIRELAQAVRATTAEAYEQWPPYTSPPTLPSPSTPERSGRARKRPSRHPKR